MISEVANCNELCFHFFFWLPQQKSSPSLRVPSGTVDCARRYRREVSRVLRRRTHPARDFFRTLVVYSFLNAGLHLRNTSARFDPPPHIQPPTGFHPGREPCAVNNKSISASENKTCGHAGGGQIGRYSESFLSPRWTDYERISLPHCLAGRLIILLQTFQLTVSPRRPRGFRGCEAFHRKR